MKKTLITIGLTTVAVLTLVALFTPKVSHTFGAINNSLPVDGMGGVSYAEAPAFAPMAVDLYSVTQESGERAVTLNFAANQASVDPQRLVIKNADLAIVVKDPKADMTRISQLANDLGGYVVSSNLYQSYYGPNSIEVPEANINIRIPAEKLDEALAVIKENAVDINREMVSGQDVTSEYVDLQSRLAAKQDAEKQLLKIMETAEKAEDVLAIYMQVQNIQTEIEVIKGQIKYYEESAAMSSVNVQLIAEEGAQPIEIGGWKIQGTAKESIQNLINFLQGFMQFLIRFFLNYLWQLLIIAVVFYGIFLVGRAIFRRVFKKKAVVEVAEEEKK